MKFCQADGTPLMDEALPVGGDDPFKTVLANPEDKLPSEPQFDPMKTMLATPPSVDLPPPSPFGDAFSVEPKDTSVKPPSFGDLSTPQFGSNPSQNDPFPQQQPSDNFGGQQSGGFGNAPSTPTFQEPEPPFGQQPNFGQQPFGQQPTEWTPPPVPQAGWDNQGLGQNTPFNPPPIKAQGQNQVFPIISLVSGIVSIFCCWLAPILGIVALVMGYLSLNNIKKDSSAYGGRGLAVAGMVTGGIGLAIGVLYYVLVIFGAVIGR
jgi:hypothetical protein